MRPEATSPADLPGAAAITKPQARRDTRIDLLRGLSLFCIFIDHIPNNCLSAITLQGFGFSDAAELFVFLAGFSAMSAYGPFFARRGFRALLARIVSRCATIYGVHVLLLVATLLVAAATSDLRGAEQALVGPMLRDGLRGLVRGLTLGALPSYLDILPLYIVLLLSFPVILLGLRQNMLLTVGFSVTIYWAANILHLNLPNHVDPMIAATWTFNPFAWQLVYVLGAAGGLAAQMRHRWLAHLPRGLGLLCWAYVGFAFLVLVASDLCPTLLKDLPFALFGNHPKTFLTPWRLLHVLALCCLALTSHKLTRIAALGAMQPVLACGRHSLPVFASGCLLSLFGRMIFKTAGTALPVQLFVNITGTMLLAWLGMWLDARQSRRSSAAAETVLPAIRQAEQTDAVQAIGPPQAWFWIRAWARARLGTLVFLRPDGTGPERRA